MLNKNDKQSEGDFEDIKAKMLKARNEQKRSGTPKTEMSEDALERMNGPVDGIELTEQEWEAVKVATAERKAFKKRS